jgi:hypothetical protein
MKGYRSVTAASVGALSVAAMTIVNACRPGTVPTEFRDAVATTASFLYAAFLAAKIDRIGKVT